MQTLKGVGSIFFTDDLKTIETEKVKFALENSQLDPELAKELAKRFCFSRAKNRIDIDKIIGEDGAEGIVDEVADNADKWIFQLSETYKKANKLSYEFNGQFWFDKASKTVGADAPELAKHVNDLFAKYGGLYLPSDLSKLIRRVFDRQNGMVSLRHQGVVYFVPSENNELMVKVSKFIEAIGAKCLVVSVNKEDKQIVEKAQTSLVDNVQTELQKIVTEMKTLKDKGEGFTNRKANTRWRQLLGQLERVKMFARSLSVDTSALLKRIRTTEFDLTLVTADNMDVLASLAQSGKLKGVVGEVAFAAFKGELPAITSPRVKEIAAMLPEIEVPDLKNGSKVSAKKSDAMVEV